VTRRQRREAQRRERAGSPPPQTLAWRSPTAIVTVAAVIVALVVIAALNLGPSATNPGSGSTQSGGSAAGQPPASSSIALTAPAAPIPSGVPQDGRTIGSPSAKVVLETWEDFQCPACGNFTRQIEPVLIERYVVPGKIRLTFHDFAFLGPESLAAASAARCAGEQGKFWDYHDWVFANQNGENKGWFSRERLAAIADHVGLDRAAWEACYDGGSQAAAVTAETDAGKAAGVASTPTLVLNGQTVPLSSFSSWDDLYKAIDAAVAAAGGAPASTAP
jgi:protein-disulfide isomerase